MAKHYVRQTFPVKNCGKYIQEESTSTVYKVSSEAIVLRMNLD